METVNFAGLIAPLTVEDFFSTYWEKKFLHQKRNEPGYFDEILAITDIDAFLSQQNLVSDGIRLMNNGEGIPPYEWTKSETLLDSTVKTTVHPEKLFKLFNRGATIIINSEEKTIPRLANACRSIEQELKIKVQSNIYITPPNSQGFAMHYDPHDIFSMQIKGPKTWQIYDSAEELPTTYRAFRKEPKLVSKFEINSGDLLYMPRGTVHEAFSSDVSTIHVNFSCKLRYGFHLLEDLAKIAEQEDVFFRSSIPNGFNNDLDHEEYIIHFKQKLLELIETTNVSRLLKKQFEHFSSHQLLDFHGRLTNLIKLEKLDLSSTVCRRKGFTYQVKYTKSNMLICYGGRELKIPAFVKSDLFLQDKPFKVEDIKGLITDKGKLEIVRELIEAGFLQIE